MVKYRKSLYAVNQRVIHFNENRPYSRLQNVVHISILSLVHELFVMST